MSEAETGSQPSHLGSYRLDSLLGRGGMGEVFLAWDERLERHVAIKRILPDSPPEARARARFLREARAVARLSHPSIVQVFELLETEDGDCLVMEHVEGDGLDLLIAKSSLDLATTLRLATQIAEGLAEAHGKGLVHRDLKAENVMVTRSGHAKILDFGLARLLWNEGLDREQIASAATRSGVLVGTVHAMSPEQASGRKIDHRSDLFALGGLLYEMLSGRPPLRGSNVLDTLRRVVSEQPEPLSELRPDLPSALLRLVDELMAKEPEDRPANAHLVVQTLADIRPGEDRERPPQASPVAPGHKPLQRVATDEHIEDLPTGEIPMPAPQADPETDFETMVRTLVVTDWQGVSQLIASLGEARAAELSASHDRMARDLLSVHGGLEIEKSTGTLSIFERPLAAVAFALAYHRGLADLEVEMDEDLSVSGIQLSARVAVHLGEIFLRRNSDEHVERGANRLEVEGAAKLMTARLAAVAEPRQTLLTQGVFDLARRSSEHDERWDEHLRWLAHGRYVLQEADEPMEIFEVGVDDWAPLRAPADSEVAKRAVSVSEELVLGWRPAPGQPIPRRPSWALEQRLGEGGFGEVWLAQHASGERRIFKFCFESSKLRALKREVTLFRVLKESLGHRDDIARVLDWNFDAPPYFLEAEHTEGGDLVSWAQQRGGLQAISLEDRVQLVAQVAEALAAAHSVGVLHKDVKPENVLIHQGSDGPRARLTDFGVGALADRSLLSDVGVPADGFTESVEEDSSTVGSRRYLAPELIAGKPSTVQADLYSLGVLLYQMVVGDFARTPASGWQRQIEDPLLEEDVAALIDGSPERRPAGAGVVAQHLRRLPQRRLERAADFAQERRRRQLRVGIWAGGVLLIVVALLAIQATFAQRQAERLRASAVEAREQAEDLVAFMLGDLQSGLQKIGQLDVLEGAGQATLDYFAAQKPEHLTGRTAGRYAQALHQMGDVRLAQADLEGALQLFQQAAEKTSEWVEREPDNLEALFELGQSRFWVGNAFYRQGQWMDASREMEAYLELAEQLHQRAPDNDQWLLEVAYGHNNVGAVAARLGNWPLARQQYEQSLEISQRLLKRDPEDRARQVRWINAHIRVAEAQIAENNLAPAYDRLSEALELARTVQEEQPEDARPIRQLSALRAQLANLAMALGEIDRARDHAQEQVDLFSMLVERDPEHSEWRTDLDVSQFMLAQMLFFERRGDDAEDLLQDLLSRQIPDLQGAELKRFERNLSHHLRLLAEIQLDRGNARSALATVRRAAALVSTKLHAGSWDRRAEAHITLGECLSQLGRDGEAEAAWQLALENLDTLSETARRYRWLDIRAQVLLHLDRRDEARTLVFTLLGMGFQHPRFLDVCRRKGDGLCSR